MCVFVMLGGEDLFLVLVYVFVDDEGVLWKRVEGDAVVWAGRGMRNWTICDDMKQRL